MLKALAEPQRVAILRLVHDRELPAGEIAHPTSLDDDLVGLIPVMRDCDANN